MKIELLEARIAPASVLSFTDVDGDLVELTVSFGDLLGTASFRNVGLGQQLEVLNLRDLQFQGVSLSTSVTKSATGDGLVNIGRIDATGRELGRVVIQGDLGAIDVGGVNRIALDLLDVRSMGRFGLATQGGAGNLVSNINGALGSLIVAGDIEGAQLAVSGMIGSILLGGSLIGGAANNSGEVSSTSNIGPVTIGHDVIGGAGDSSGRIRAGGTLGNVTVGGSLIGGSSTNSGELLSIGDMGAVKIAHNLIGGIGVASGFIGAAKLASLTLGGSLIGGDGNLSGSVFSTDDIGPVKITHDLKGGRGAESGKIDSGGAITRITIGGSLIGGDGAQNTFTSPNGTPHQGQIFAAANIGPVKIAHDMQGGRGVASSTITTLANLASISIGGSLIGGAGESSGRLQSFGDTGNVSVGHDIIGGNGSSSGGIFAEGKLGAISIGGSLLGGAGETSGSIVTDGSMGAVKIGQDMLGGTGVGSGLLDADGKIASLRIGGSLVGGSANFSGGVFAGDLGPVWIAHDIVGGSISEAMASLDSTGVILSGQRIAGITIGGSIIAGIDGSSAGDLSTNASIRAGDNIGSLSVKGGLIGNVSATGDSFVIISARGQATPGTRTDVAIGKVSIGDRVEFAQIFAGYDTTLQPTNGDAQIGKVSVGGDWASSSLVAGAFNVGADGVPGGTGAGADNVNFGDLRDRAIPTGSGAIVARIASIKVAGQVFGTPTTFANLVNHFGFVAERIDALTIGGQSFRLNEGAGNDGFILGHSLNMTLHEVDALIGSTLPGTVPAAKLVNAKTLTYTDIDGDHVTVKLSRPLLRASNVDDVFTFDTGTVSGGEAEPRQLQVVNLSVLASNGLSLKISVKPGGGLADGLANVGYIDSTGFNLGKVILRGDLGQIEAGTGTPNSTGLRALTVRTLGRLSLDTQPAATATFTPDVQSMIKGDLGSLTVEADVVSASLFAEGSIGPVTIGGSLIGGQSDFTGIIGAGEGVGRVKIGAQLQGGAGVGSGEITSGNKTASVVVGGSFIGGAGGFGGRVVTDGDIGPVKIGHNLLGGTSDRAGRIEGSTLSSITIGGSLLGGLGAASGNLTSYSGDIGAVKIGNNLHGGAGDDSGRIDAGSRLISLKVGGSLIGSAGNQATDADGTSRYGQVFSRDGLGSLSIGHDLVGGSALYSGTVRTLGSMGNVTVGGSIVGGSNLVCGGIAASGNLGSVMIGHDLQGSAGNVSGFIEGRGTIRSINIGGSVVGGSNSNTGSIFTLGDVGSVHIGHDLLGGTDTFSGYLQIAGKLSTLAIGGSVIGGSASVTGRVFCDSLGVVNIGHDLIGGSISGTVTTLDSTGLILSTQGIGIITIGGSIISGIDDSIPGFLTRNGSIRSGADIGSLTVRGSLIGNSGPNGLSPVVISAVGQSTLDINNDVAIGTLSIGGRVEHALILAGYSSSVNYFNTPAGAVNGNAQIGRVSVGGDWIASSLAAGVADTANNGFGNSDDSVINVVAAARIASIQIAGVVAGTDTPGDHFGFVAPQIDFFRSAGFVAPLASSFAPIELSLITGDVTIRRL